MRVLDFLSAVLALDMQIQARQRKCEAYRLVGRRGVLCRKSVYYMLMDEIRTCVCERVIGKLVILLFRIH